MALDPNIILRGTSVQPLDPVTTMTNALAVRGALSNQRAQEAERMRQNALRQATVLGPDGRIDQAATSRNMLSLVGPDELAKTQHQWSVDELAVQKAQNEERKAKLEAAEKNYALVGNALAALGPNPPIEQLHAAAQGLLRQGLQLDLSQLPQSQDQVPGYIQQTQRQVMGVKETLAAQRADLELLGKQNEPKTDYWKAVADRERYERNGGTFVPPQLRGGSNFLAGGAPMPADVGAPEGGTVKPFTKTMPQPEPDAQTEPSLTVARNPGIALENRLAYGDVKAWERDAEGRPVPVPAVQQYELNKAKAGASNINVAGGDMALGKSASNKVDEGLLSTTEKLASLDNIRAQYRPEFQQIGPRLSAGWSAIKSKLGTELPESERQTLRAFSSYKRGAIEQLNAYIKEMTGAAMGVQEAQRLRLGMPDPGQNWYDGDSPDEFEAKLDDTIRAAKLAEARWTFIKKNGIQLKGDDLSKAYPLDKMPSLMNQRGKFLEESLRKQFPSMKPAEVQAEVKRQLATEFGLVGN